MNLDYLMSQTPFSLAKHAKEEFLTKHLLQLTKHHIEKCTSYRKILTALDVNLLDVTTYTQLPFLPTGLFKEMTLASVPMEEVIKTMTSSGTTGQAVSKIYLDKFSAAMQTKVLVAIVSDFIGKNRLPLVVIDTEAVIKNRQLFSARGAGILGFSIFGNKKIYALDEGMKIDVKALKEFVANQGGGPIMLFGFTFMVWLHFLLEIESSNIEIDLSSAILIHGGGFKKLADNAVSKEEFKARLNRATGILPNNIHDYYGMVEQTGTISIECENGFLHTSNFSDIIIRRVGDFSIASFGESGIVQSVSVLPHSYPGHSLLTEDEGVCVGEDDCSCGRKGKYFQIFGRLHRAEIRGCSDTYATNG